jgi:hypothetical protein
MTHYVPVVDQEAPRLEREDRGAEWRKHRKFDNPFTVEREERKKKVWEMCVG